MFKSASSSLAAFLLLAFSQLALAIDPADLLKPEQAYPLTAEARSAEQLKLSWDIAKDYYLYRAKFRFASKTPGVTLGEAEFPTGEKKHDDFFGEMEIYRGHIDVWLPIKREDPAVGTLDLEVSVQGCADVGVCFPPYKQTVSVPLPQTSGSAPPGGGDTLSKLLANKSFGASVQQDNLLPPDQAFHFIGEAKDADTLHVSWQIADGYYLYRERFRFALVDADGIELGAVDIPHGQVKQEENGPMEVFHREIGFDLPLKRTGTAPATVQLQARYQGCAEKGVCYPPMQKLVALDLPASTAPTAQTAVPAAEQDRIAASLQRDSIGLTSLTFLGFGLLMAFSPCLFPMIPILSGIIVGHGHRVTTGKAFLLSLSYVLAAAVTYTIFGVLAGLFGGNLQAAFQNPWLIGAFAALFVLLALSMFDFYALQMPEFLRERIAAVSHRQKGGTLAGAAVMGSLSALIVGPCMAAPLAGALIYIGQTGDALLGGLALFSLGLGMGIPLLIIGTSAGKLLPKAGVWMNAVKAVFGVGMLAVAVSLLERIVPAQLSMLMWALLLIVPSIYMGAVDALPEKASGWRRLWKGVGIGMLVYGVLLLVGVASNGNDPLQPLRGLTLATAESAAKPTAFRKITTMAELDAQLKAARAQGRWAMVDYYADWCTSCKEMERYTFADPHVQSATSDMALLQVDVTGNGDDARRLLDRYGLIGPPATLFFGPDGIERREHRLVGFLSADDFIALLAKVKP